ncbi:MAG: hypothetical protein ACOCUA_02340 [archaeon]
MADLTLQRLDGTEGPWVVMEGRNSKEWLASTELVHLEDHR